MKKIEKIAYRLFDNWNSGRNYEELSGEFALGSVSEAYETQLFLQGLHVEKRGEIAGRKIALSSVAMQQMVGISHPIAGAFFTQDILFSPATIRMDKFVHLGLEFELAIELNSDIPPQAEAHSSRTVQNYIATVRPAFELIEDRNADYTNLDPLTLIADNAWCGGIVLGEPLENWRELDLGNIPSVVYQREEIDEKTNTGAADPLSSFAWVLNHFSDRGISLSRGEHIITGSSVRTRFPVANDRYTYHMSEVSVTVEIT